MEKGGKRLSVTERSIANIKLAIQKHFNAPDLSEIEKKTAICRCAPDGPYPRKIQEK